jgi:hypothetical protein
MAKRKAEYREALRRVRGGGYLSEYHNAMRVALVNKGFRSEEPLLEAPAKIEVDVSQVTEWVAGRKLASYDAVWSTMYGRFRGSHVTLLNLRTVAEAAILRTLPDSVTHLKLSIAWPATRTTDDLFFGIQRMRAIARNLRERPGVRDLHIEAQLQPGAAPPQEQEPTTHAGLRISDFAAPGLETLCIKLPLERVSFALIGGTGTEAAAMMPRLRRFGLKSSQAMGFYDNLTPFLRAHAATLESISISAAAGRVQRDPFTPGGAGDAWPPFPRLASLRVPVSSDTRMGSVLALLDPQRFPQLRWLDLETARGIISLAPQPSGDTHRGSFAAHP